jgi:hypothetical protein
MAPRHSIDANLMKQTCLARGDHNVRHHSAGNVFYRAVIAPPVSAIAETTRSRKNTKRHTTTLDFVISPNPGTLSPQPLIARQKLKDS